MVKSQFSLCCSSYKTNLINGFTALQQNQDLVDMTLAADGHLVKVHQVLMALASPYIKELLISAPCQHPVIFLNNVSHNIMSLLLEYIYTGEVVIPPDDLASFIDAAKSLHIKGLENMNSYDKPKQSSNEKIIQSLDTQETCPIDSGGDNDTSVEPRYQYEIKAESLGLPSLPVTSTATFSKTIAPQITTAYTDATEDYTFNDSMEIDSDDNATISQYQLKKPDDPQKVNLQFSVSNRGCLQIILNRYIYSLNYTRTKSSVRRWKCIDYRNKKCTAFVITKGNIAIKRANLHNHSFHDKKILSKLEKNCVYSAMDEVEALQNANEKTT